MSRLAILAILAAPFAALAQPAAPLPETMEIEPAPAEQHPAAAAQHPAAAPPIEYSAHEPAAHEQAPARVVDQAVQQKILEVNQELDRSTAAAAPPVAAVETEPSVWSPLESGLRSAFGLLSVLALLFLLAYLAKRFGKNSALFAGSDLGRPLGKIYLSPKASLHFVRTGGKILVVGVTANTISPVAEFEADSFEPTATEQSGETGAESVNAAQAERETFLAQFKASLENITRADPAGTAEEDGAEIAALREDVQRLQHYLRESVRGEDKQ